MKTAGAHWTRLSQSPLPILSGAVTAGMLFGLALAVIIHLRAESNPLFEKTALLTFRNLSQSDLLNGNLGHGTEFATGEGKAETLIKIYALQELGGNGEAGVRKGIELLSQNRFGKRTYRLFAALVEGCFLVKVPSDSSLRSLLRSVDEKEALILLGAYLKFGPAKLMAEIQRNASAVVREIPWMNSAAVQEEVRKLVVNAWLANGAEDIDAAIANNGDVEKLLRGVENEFTKLAIFDPNKAREVLTRVAIRAPESAAKLFVSSRIGFDQLASVCSACNENARSRFLNFLGEKMEEVSPLAFQLFFANVPVAFVPPETRVRFAKWGFATSTAGVARWLSSLGEREAATVLDKAVYLSTSQGMLPSEAEEYLAARLPLGHFDVNALARPLSIIAKENPASAELLMSSLPTDTRSRVQGLVNRNIIPSLALKDASMFIEKQAEVPDQERPLLLKTAANLARETGAVDWKTIADGLPPRDRLTFLGELLGKGADGIENVSLSFFDLQSVADRILREGPPPAYTQSLVDFASMLAKRDPSKALEMAVTFPNDKERNRAISASISAWADTDPEAACNWAESMPKGKDRDLAIAAIIRTAPDELDVALRSVAAIDDGGTRRRLLKELEDVWAKADPSAFRAAMNAAGFRDPQ